MRLLEDKTFTNGNSSDCTDCQHRCESEHNHWAFFRRPGNPSLLARAVRFCLRQSVIRSLCLWFAPERLLLTRLLQLGERIRRCTSQQEGLPPPTLGLQCLGSTRFCALTHPPPFHTALSLISWIRMEMLPSFHPGRRLGSLCPSTPTSHQFPVLLILPLDAALTAPTCILLS